jgi:hypothetical protein
MTAVLFLFLFVLRNSKYLDHDVLCYNTMESGKQVTIVFRENGNCIFGNSISRFTWCSNLEDHCLA